MVSRWRRWRESALVLEPLEPGSEVGVEPPPFGLGAAFSEHEKNSYLGHSTFRATTGPTGTVESNISSDQTTCNELKRTLSGLQRHRSAATRSVEAMQTIRRLLATAIPPVRTARTQSTKSPREEARRQLASLLGVDYQELCFTSGGSESNNAILRQFLRADKPNHWILSHWNILR